MADTGWNEDWLKNHQARMAGLVSRSASPPAALPTPEKPKTKAQRKREEDDLQRGVAKFLDYALMLPFKWLHIPNGGLRDKAIAGILKAFGVKKGAADAMILGPLPKSIGHSFVWIELKASEGALSKEQREWRDWCRAIGAPWFLCRSIDDVAEALTSCGVPLRGRPI